MSAERYVRTIPTCPACGRILSTGDRDGSAFKCSRSRCRRRSPVQEVYDV